MQMQQRITTKKKTANHNECVEVNRTKGKRGTKEMEICCLRNKKKNAMKGRKRDEKERITLNRRGI